MPNDARQYLLQQFDIAWQLTSYHLTGLTTEECLWRPADRGLHVQQQANGLWIADWPDHEGYDLGPPSIAWLTWHLSFWWSMVINHSFGDATLARELVNWPGDADQIRTHIEQLASDWRTKIESLTDEELHSTARTKWPLTDRPFGDIIAWANIELTKNASEIGYARFLYAVRTR